MIKLRPYQEEAITSLSNEFKKGNKWVIFCLPTGAGKTVTFSEMCARTINKLRKKEGLFTKSKILIFTDRKELLDQAHSTLFNFGLSPSFIKAGQKKIDKSKSIFVCMVETLKRRLKKDKDYIKNELGKISLIIIDEAHKGNFRELHQYFKDVHCIGATATPIAASKKYPLNDYFQSIVDSVQIDDLISQGFLNPAKTFAVNTDTSKLKTSSTGDYTDSSLMEVFDKHQLYEGLIDNYERICPNTKTLIFCVNIEHTKKVNQSFLERGYQSMSLDSTCTKEYRTKVLKWFHENDNVILCNCSILTTGFDEPSIETIIVNRATKSLPLFLQMCGRGSRLSEGKKYFNILDMGNNCLHHGLWSAKRNWTKIFNDPKEAKGGEAPLKSCSVPALKNNAIGCFNVVPASSRNCPFCGEEFIIEEKELVKVVLEEVQIGEVPEELRKPYSSMSVSELIERAKYGSVNTGKPFKIGWIVHQAVNNWGADGLRKVAKIKNYSNGWIFHQRKQFNV